ILYCEVCGEPIINLYECIGHHKQELTMQNVNDYSVSLNPANVMLVHLSCHNMIHARFGFMAQKKVYYVWGAPCSGKSTFVQANKGNSDLVVDIDLLWQAATGGILYVKPDALKTPVFLLRDSLLDIVKTRTGKWERAWVIEGGARKGDRMRRIAALGAEDIFINVDKETCMRRLANDERRTCVRDVWHKYISDWFAQYQP
ncbi:MAG: HNH endonuclease, partial [Bacteroidaceae bacterium]|nr:HNH endonuclease [Bacteroidaceae bacterium]